MKLRKGFRAVWSDGTVWYGDCQKWAEECRKVGVRVEPARIFGSGKWSCTGCVLNMH